MDEGKPTRPLRIGIAGGSIAGCVAAVELSRAGHRVTVYEKSSGELSGHGAAVATPAVTLQALVARDLISISMPYLSVYRQPFITHVGPDHPQGHLAYTAPVNMALVNWSDLYRRLRARVPGDSYHAGRQVIGAGMINETTAELHFAGGARERFDLVVFADGYRSTGRSLIFPDVPLEYTGYIQWLGRLDETGVADSALLDGAFTRVPLAKSGGHAVFHLVPGPDGSVIKGRRKVNWTCTIPIPGDEFVSVKELAGRPPAELESRLQNQVCAQLPPYYAALVKASGNTSIQPAYRLEIPAYHRQRLCLIGDAGTLTPPFSSSGVFKATGNAIDLAAALGEITDVDTALSEWGYAQTLAGQRLLTMSRQMEQALIWQMPDLTGMDEGAVAGWWRKAVSFPDEFV